MREEHHLGFYLKMTHEHFVSGRNRRLKRFGITSSQMDVLIYLFHNDGRVITQRDVEKHFGLTHSTVIGILKRLCEKGYILVEQSSDDRRQRNIRITEKALEIKDDMLDDRRRMNKIIEEKLGREEYDALLEGMKKFYSVLQEDSDD